MKKAVTIFDVGFGDTIYIRIEDDKEIRSYLIDCGYPRSISPYIPYLKEKGVDYIILTHSHSDHISGVEKLLKEGLKVKGIIWRRDDYDCEGSKCVSKLLDLEESEEVLFCDLLDDVAVDKLKDFVILYPTKTVNANRFYKDSNKNSIVMALKFGEGYFLFMGDSTRKEEKLIVSGNDIDFKKVKYVKIGHHGSNTSTGNMLIDNINMDRVGIISCDGSNNPPPHRDYIEQRWRSKNNEAELFYTECMCTNGSIKIFDNGRVERL